MRARTGGVWERCTHRDPVPLPFDCAPLYVGIVTKLVVLALVAVGLFLGYQKLRDTDPSRLPAPPDYPTVTPPPVSVNVPNPLR